MKIFRDATLTGKLILLSLLGIYGVISFWLFYPYTPGMIEEPIKIINENQQLVPGEVLIYELDMNKLLPLSATISKQLIFENGFVLTFTPIIGNIKEGEFVKLFPLETPHFAPLGKCILKWEGIYHVNPIRDVSIIARSEPFWFTEG